MWKKNWLSMKQKTTKCQYPDWEGGIIPSKHVFGKDGICVVCGELQEQATAQQVVSDMLDENGFVDTLHLGC